jgi:hypothetical protein
MSFFCEVSYLDSASSALRFHSSSAAFSESTSSGEAHQENILALVSRTTNAVIKRTSECVGVLVKERFQLRALLLDKLKRCLACRVVRQCINVRI